MALPTSLQADVDSVRAIATEYEALEKKVRDLVRLWERNNNSNALPENETISPGATAEDETELPGVIGGDIKQAVAALKARFDATVTLPDSSDSLTRISKVALP